MQNVSRRGFGDTKILTKAVYAERQCQLSFKNYQLSINPVHSNFVLEIMHCLFVLTERQHMTVLVV